MTEVGNASYQEAEAEAVYHSKSEGSWQLNKILSSEWTMKIGVQACLCQFDKARVIREEKNLNRDNTSIKSAVVKYLDIFLISEWLGRTLF